MAKRVHVVVGVVFDSDRKKVLISKRSGKQHLSGLWEFPGGKVEHNEGVQTALARELYEELDIVVNKTKALTKISFDYPDKKVLLDVWWVDDWQGNVVGREGQEVRWVPVDELTSFSFPDANKYIISLISLADIYLISQASYENVDHMFSVVKECFSAGLKLFQLRLDLREAYNFTSVVNELKILATHYQAKLILNGSPKDTKRYHLDGVHFNSKELFKHASRPIDKKYILGASCHNEKELAQAALLNVDYVFISPVLTTKSHPEQTAIGWAEFNRLAGKTNIPAYALGGLCVKDLHKAKVSGAHGIAMLSSVWNSKQPGKVIQGL